MTAWLALLFGTLGVHRFYLHGVRDGLAWLFPVPTLVGLYGMLRMRALGVDDTLGSILVPLLGVMIAVAMLSAIIYALTPEAKWQQRYAPGSPAASKTGLAAVFAAMFALLIGGAALMAAIAFSAQRFFEWEMAAQPVAALQDTRVMAWSATPER